MKHNIKIFDHVDNELMDKIHIFCITEWYVKHHNENHYGASATVCFPFSYSADSYQLMPVQCIYNQYAHAKIHVNILGRVEGKYCV